MIIAAASFVLAGTDFTSATSQSGRFSCQLGKRDAAAAVEIAVRAAFEKDWQASAGGWLSHYRLAGEQRNPLRPDLASDDTAPITGYAFVSGLKCVVLEKQTVDAAETPAIIGIVADTLRFNENRAGWTVPIEEALVVALRLSATDQGWEAAAIPHDALVVPPDAQWSRPAVASAPKHDVWPRRPCTAPKLWTGTFCKAPAKNP